MSFELTVNLAPYSYNVMAVLGFTLGKHCEGLMKLGKKPLELGYKQVFDKVISTCCDLG